MIIKYTYDMSKINTEGLSENDSVKYLDTIEYILQAENKNLPKEFVCYRGNMYADDLTEVEQKHGSQLTYETVPLPRNTDETRSKSLVQRYCWQLKNEYITNSLLFPIFLRFKYIEKTRANSNDTLLFYPRQYASKIEIVDFDINFISNKNVLKKVELFKVWKDGDKFKHTPISGVNLSDNKASIQIQPDTTKYEAYYFRV